MSTEDAASGPAGIAYLPDVDQLFVKLFNGSGAFLEVAELQSTARTANEATITAHFTRDEQLASVVIHEASRKVPGGVRKELAGAWFARNDLTVVGTLQPRWWSEFPDALAFPFFDGALNVVRQADMCVLHEDLAPIGLLKANSGKVVAILVFEATRRLPAEMLPS